MEEAIPLKVLKIIFWILEIFFISCQNEDDYHQNSNDNYEHDSSDEHDSSGLPQQDATKTTLQQALELFEIESLDCKEITKETVRKKYRRLSLTYHPDRNKNSPESIQQMQKINEYNETLLHEIDKRDGILPSCGDDDNNSGNSNTEVQETSPTENEPISKEERKRQKKARQETERQWKEEQKRQQNAYEEMLRQERQETERLWKEYKQRQKRLKKEHRKIKKKYWAAGLSNPIKRQEAHSQWIRETMCHREDYEIDEEPTQNYRPKNLVMEYSTNEVAVALRRGEREIAIELVHNKISGAAELWFMENFHKLESENKLTDYQMNELRDKVLVNALLAPLDEDYNNILHYAVYFRDEEMLSYFIQEARRWERLVECVMATNIYELSAKDYVIYIKDKMIQNHFSRLMNKVEKIIESRRSVPTFWKLLAKYNKVPSLVPFVLSMFGLLLGLIVFETGWVVSLGGVVFTLATPESPMHQNIRVDPSCLPQNMFSYHGVWFAAKVIYFGIAAAVPAVSDYYYFSIPLLIILLLLMGNYFLDPIFKVNNFIHQSITFLVGFIPFSRRLPLLLRTTGWLGIYFGILLFVKTFAITIRASDLFAIEPSSLESFPTRSDSTRLAMDTFNAVMREEDNGEL